MRGLGFFVWHLSSLFPLDLTIQKLQALNVRWVSIKVLDGTRPFNFIDAQGRYVGNSDFLQAAIHMFRQAGIEVGGWGFLYTSSPAAQARAANTMVTDLALSHWLIDAEHIPGLGAMWKFPGADAAATAYMNAINMPGIPVGLCSYRYPSYHREFPWSQFMNHPKVTLAAPQVYWMQAHNAGFQLQRSYAEYAPWRSKPYLPFGATFHEAGWEAQPEEVREFVATAQSLGLEAWGFWDLDQAIGREDWLEAAAGIDLPPVLPPPPEPEPREQVTAEVYHVVRDYTNVRSTIIPSRKYGPVPGRTYQPSTVYFQARLGDQVEALEVIEDGHNVWLRIGRNQYIARMYDDVLMTD